MSSKIYFKENNTSILKHVIRVISGSYHYLRPAGAEKRVRKLLTSPQKRAPADIPDDINAQSLATHYGELMTYSIGKGPTILFIHGWSGSGSQFFELMRETAKKGYRAITYDHYKHGHSGGRECNYPLFIHSLKSLADYFYNTKSLAGVVSHSMGASAALDFFKEKDIPHFLIAPLFNFYEELESRVKGIGIAPKLFEAIVTSIENDYNIEVRNHDSMRDINLIKSSIDIIHSKSDKFALYEFSKTLSEKNDNINLHSVDKVGHMRIVNIPETKKVLTEILKKKQPAEALTT
ncbi:MAG: alpha/beta hydrolase [Cellvibrionaceae bacterium]